MRFAKICSLNGKNFKNFKKEHDANGEISFHTSKYILKVAKSLSKEWSLSKDVVFSESKMAKGALVGPFIEQLL